ncbi:hypothetical protein BC832DRAFT_615126 [Gaertneriomyces semiglobifer]|nr:hypothetical protein BC832DRAFT_615126 [Gaertneriomyces semiglobifer]
MTLGATYEIASGETVGACTRPSAGGDGITELGGNCSDDSDCILTLQCAVKSGTTKVCALKTPGPPGTPCAIRADCNNFGACDFVSGTTVCVATGSVYVRQTPKSVKRYGLCAITADCEDIDGSAGFCERANATAGLPGRCVGGRSLGVACTAKEQCITGTCTNQLCAFGSTGALIAAPINVPAVTVVANQPATVPLPAGVDAETYGYRPPGRGISVFLNIEPPAGDLSDASLDFEYLEAMQTETGLTGDELTWYSFNEEEVCGVRSGLE